ncbi:MAG TPA: PTS system mannose/fructose/sorbose family transporter subunit IID [Elusimicrobiota bacterium]|nr:PTS system mannose/fructose/sorbose family transporter subunit IID [Elusimicrobiota bacterium]
MSSLRPRLFLRSLLLQAGFCDERRQGLGFAWAIDPALQAAYAGDAAGLRAARLRHLAPFNAQPYAAALPLGVAAALEARAAGGDAAAAARGGALKSSLGAALSGAADAFFWGSLRPLAAASALLGGIVAYRLDSPRPFVCGAVVGLALFNAPALWTRWAGLGLGLREGEGAALSACALPAQKWIRAARVAALAAVVAAAAAALALPRELLGMPRAIAALAFAAGACLGKWTGGPLRLVAAAGVAGAAAAAWGWAP